MAMFPGVILFISWCSVSLDRNLIKYLVIHTEEAEKVPYSLDSQNALYFSTGKEKQQFWWIYSQCDFWNILYDNLRQCFCKVSPKCTVDLSGKKAKSEKTGFGDVEK